jgi:hypothetical protein
MMHNPFQSYQTDPTLGAYSGLGSPFSLPYQAMQTSAINPALNPLTAQGLAACATAGIPQLAQQGYTGVPNFIGGLHPQQQLQLASILATQFQNPYQVAGLQNPALQNPGLQNFAFQGQNPWIQSGLQNPWHTAALQNPLLNPILAQQLGIAGGSPFGAQPYQQFGHLGQQVSPFGQQVSPFGQQGLPYAQQGPYGQQVSPFGQQGLPYTQQGIPYGQQISPFGAQGLPYGQMIGSPLAPQTWVGQAGQFGGGQPFGQINPLAQLGARQFHTPGISPWGGF